MNPAVAICTACSYVFPDQGALDPCPKCGSTDRTLHREGIVIDRSEPDRVLKKRHIEERQPDGSWEIVERPLSNGQGARRGS